MKKLSLIVAGLSVLVGLTVQAADTNAVTSANIVGLIRTDVESNKLVFTAINMSAVGGSNQIFKTAVGAQLPVGSIAYFWNVTSQKWDQAINQDKGSWGAAVDNRLVPAGQGVFIKSSSNLTLNLLGEVPLAPSSAVTLVSGLNAFGYAYPVDTVWSNTALSVVLTNGSSFYIWNVASNKWDQAIKQDKGGWGAAASSRIIKAGQAFFVNNKGGPTNISERRPFTP